MFFLVYKTTNLVNGKIYIGCHKTDDINDGYIGSGTHMRRAVVKHGRDNFHRELLGVFQNKEEMFALEASLVTPEFVARKDTYNIMVGGRGGWDHINVNGLQHTERRKAAVRAVIHHATAGSIRRWANPVYKAQMIAKVSLALVGRQPSFAGKRHTEITKLKIGRANAVQQSGAKNSMFGTCWIYDPTTHASIRISRKDLGAWADRGWRPGRKMRLLVPTAGLEPATSRSTAARSRPTELL